MRKKKEMRICRDCKFCEPWVTGILWFKEINYKYARCGYKSKINLVSGELEKVVLLFDKRHNKVIAKIYPHARRLKNLLEN